MPEVLGVATVCVEGRRRRHLGTAAVSRMVLANASVALLEPQRLASALALGLRCLTERNHYEVRGTLSCKNHSLRRLKELYQGLLQTLSICHARPLCLEKRIFVNWPFTSEELPI